MNGLRIFGVRHLSPASAHHLLSCLDNNKPRCVLIEGPSDCSGLLSHLAGKGVKPPVALLAYTTESPIRTILYPYASYSPEYQAICWAFKNGAEVRFIDLPTGVTISLDINMHEDTGQGGQATEAQGVCVKAVQGGQVKAANSESGYAVADRDAGKKISADVRGLKDGSRGIGSAHGQGCYANAAESKEAQEDGSHGSHGDGSTPEDAEGVNEYYEAQARFYSGVAERAGEPDYETFWERHFEHCADPDGFAEKMAAMSGSLRGSLEALQWEEERKDAAYNYIRESYMKRGIAKAVSDGYGEDEIVVVTGAYHMGGLSDPDLPPMGDEEFEKLPAVTAKTTLMPYSYYRLSSRSGYGAGNKAPAYFQLMWECMQRGDLESLAPTYLSSLGGEIRSGGNYNSTANVIEAVRLAKSLAFMHGADLPTLNDLHDSAVCLLGYGELPAVSEAIARVDIGTAIGELPEGVSQTPVQDDMNRQLKRLKLEKYKSVVAQDLELDLRENRNVSSRESAYLDLNRSVFFNRLLLLGIGFAVSQGTGPSTWSEKWALRWTPENEIEIVEATLKGDSIETASAFVLKEEFDAAGNILEIAKLMRKAFVCQLPTEVPNGLQRLQELCVEGESFSEAAFTALEISDIIKYRDVRGFETEPLVPVLQQVFLRAALVMFDGAACDDDASNEFIRAIEAMHNVSQEQFELIDDEEWLKRLRELAESDSRNAKVSGVATAVLMERNEISDDELKTEVGRRLSYGVPGDLAASWFEGLCARNRWALLSRTGIWEQLDGYLGALEESEFRRALVFLRRAFSTFDPKEKNSITEILADLWGIDAGSLGEFLRDELSEDEQGKLDALNDFDFDL